MRAQDCRCRRVQCYGDRDWSCRAADSVDSGAIVAGRNIVGTDSTWGVVNRAGRRCTSIKDAGSDIESATTCV